MKRALRMPASVGVFTGLLALTPVGADAQNLGVLGDAQSTGALLASEGEELQPSLRRTQAGSPLKAYWKPAISGQYEIGFQAHSGTGSELSFSNWHLGKVGAGYLPRLVNAPRAGHSPRAGHLMVSIDTPTGAAAGTEPTKIDVRKYEEDAKAFGAPTTNALSGTAWEPRARRLRSRRESTFRKTVTGVTATTPARPRPPPPRS